LKFVTPAKAGVHGQRRFWFRLSAGMTGFRRNDGLSPE
jgi:hypothetical protein